MACAGCVQRGRAIRDASVALRNGDTTQARRDLAVVTRSIADDTKAFARRLQARIRQAPRKF